MTSYFSPNYNNARARFVAAADALGTRTQSHVLPGFTGAEGEPLALDTALFAPPKARRLLVLSSAVHGVEGFCGSGCQLAFLHDADMQRRAQAAGVAVLLLHAVNPYGFSHLRRTNEQNIDINRNAIDFSQPRADNPAYREIRDWLIPEQWPETQENAAHIAAYIERNGEQAYQRAVTAGQYDDAQGLFYGGVAPAWSNLTVRKILREIGADFSDIGWIDFHTGLGPYGHAEKIFAGRPGPDELPRARSWWGADVVAPFAGDSSSANVSGPLAGVIYDECAHARTTVLALEYGTLPVNDMLNALRADQCLQNHPDMPAAQRVAIKQVMRDAFYGDDDVWRGMILGQARVGIMQAIAGLALDRGN
jgi:hypothetical protein